jgi:hypothetical protein
MKRILFTAVLIMYTSFFTAQSKQETIDWLNTKLEFSPISISGSLESTFYTKINSKGVFSNTSISESKLTGYKSVSIFSGHLSSLSPSSIMIKKNNNNQYYISASCSSGKCITQKSSYEDGTNANYELNTVTLCLVNNYELAERCKKAFTHLINIFGGKKEAF